MKHVPMRSCIVCRQQKDKSELLRIVRSSDGAVAIDTTGKAQGRGAYICKTGECMSNAVKKRALGRAFKQQLPDDVYEELSRAYDELNAND